jgi:hypothetical protein
MKNTILSVVVILSALSATDALAQGFVDQYGREFRAPAEADAPPRATRPKAQQPRRGPLDARAEREPGPRAFDGAWSVAINTQSGACDPSYRFGVQIINGSVVYEGRTSGRVAPNGGVQVSIAQGDQQAFGQGRLSRAQGSGVWRGHGSAGTCAGTWVAERRGSPQ